METTPRPSNKSDYIVLLVAIILLAASIYDANYAFIIGFFAIPIGLYKLIRNLFSKQKRDNVSKLIIYGSFSAILVSGPAGCALAHLKVHRSAAPIIQALNEYYKTNKKYPNTLENIPSINTHSCPNGMKMFYYSPEELQSFSLTCVTFAFNKHTYESATGKWENWD